MLQVLAHAVCTWHVSTSLCLWWQAVWGSCRQLASMCSVCSSVGCRELDCCPFTHNFQNKHANRSLHGVGILSVCVCHTALPLPCFICLYAAFFLLATE
jgi:hypothetical protein